MPELLLELKFLLFSFSFVLIGYEAKVQIPSVGKKPTGRIFLNFLEGDKINSKLTCGLLIESDFIARVHARGDDVLNESINGGK
jgi:hypothetical protein